MAFNLDPHRSVGFVPGESGQTEAQRLLFGSLAEEDTLYPTVEGATAVHSDGSS